MRRCRLCRVIPLGLYTFALAAGAAAQSRFQVPDGCGTDAEFRSEIERLTGAPAPRDAPSLLHIEALGGEPGGYELRLELEDELRVLRDPECRVLFRSAIVIVAAASRDGALPAAAPPAPAPPAPVLPESPPVPPLAAPPAPAPVRAPARPPRAQRSATTPRERRYARLVRSRATSAAARADTDASRAPAPEPPMVPDAASDRISSPPARVEPAPVDRAPRPLLLGAELGLGASSGVLPDLGTKLDLGARLELGSWGASVSFHYWPQRSDTRDGRSVQVSALGGRIAALLRVAPVLDVLAGLELNRLSGEGAEGVLGRNADVVWQVAPTFGLNFITWDIQYLRLDIGVLGRVSVQRPRFLVTGFGELYQVPVVGADAIIRGVWLFR